ncbi:MAG: class I SAM-dependent methyltransferase [Bryobacteraceae bacterium]|nr:class I SAM-dependent methyltransferase [Bryobacteraceae bacterium]
MSRATYLLSEAWYDYLLSMSLREPDILNRLRAETAAHPRAQMQIPPDQGQLLQLLIELTGARRTLEIGVFTGYSSLAVALALPPDGRIIACDVSEEYTAIARRYWREAQVEHKIELRLGPALDTLRTLEAQAGSFDFAFIDADKANYDAYYEAALRLVRTGGLIAIDNVFQMGRALEPDAAADPDVAALRVLNTKIKADSRVTTVTLPIADGLTLARKR